MHPRSTSRALATRLGRAGFVPGRDSRRCARQNPSSRLRRRERPRRRELERTRADPRALVTRRIPPTRAMRTSSATPCGLRRLGQTRAGSVLVTRRIRLPRSGRALREESSPGPARRRATDHATRRARAACARTRVPGGGDRHPLLRRARSDRGRGR